MAVSFPCGILHCSKHSNHLSDCLVSLLRKVLIGLISFVLSRNGLLPLVSSDFFDTSSRSFVPYPPIGIARSELLGASAMGVAAFGGGVYD